MAVLCLHSLHVGHEGLELLAVGVQLHEQLDVERISLKRKKLKSYLVLVRVHVGVLLEYLVRKNFFVGLSGLPLFITLS